MVSGSPNRRSITLQIILVLAILALVSSVVAYLLSQRPSTSSRSVNFLVEASGGYSIITLKAGDVTISKPTTVSTPWRRTVQVPSGTEVYLTAANPTQTGKFSCSISFDGTLWKHESKEAPQDGVACAGIVP